MDHRLVSLVFLNGLRDAPPSHSARSGHIILAVFATLPPRSRHVPSGCRGCAASSETPLPAVTRSRCPPPAASSRRVPRQPLDAAEDLPKEAAGQVAFCQLEHEVSSVPNEAPAGLEQPLLETREGPALDGDGQNQPP